MKFPTGYVPGVGVVKASGFGGVGQRMMEGMGWSKGQGLGKEKHGMKDAIEVKKKEDTTGVGANSGYNWGAKSWENAFNQAAQAIGHESESSSSSDSSDEDEEHLTGWRLKVLAFARYFPRKENFELAANVFFINCAWIELCMSSRQVAKLLQRQLASFTYTASAGILIKLCWICVKDPYVTWFRCRRVPQS